MAPGSAVYDATNPSTPIFILRSSPDLLAVTIHLAMTYSVVQMTSRLNIQRRETFELRLVVRRRQSAERDHKAADARLGEAREFRLHRAALARDASHNGDVELGEVAPHCAAFITQGREVTLHIVG